MNKFVIGIFDSGIGGLTILKEIKKYLPEYDYIYLGDNARAPYGNHSFEIVYEFTRQAIRWLFEQNCSLIIIACNTASAKALRTIQQNDLPHFGSEKKVLGVIRPTTEIIGDFSTTKHIGILGTLGTIQSRSYIVEIEKFFPDLKIFQQASPMLVPLIENNEFNNLACDYFIEKYLQALLNQSAKIDTILLACTHYPIIYQQIKKFLPKNIQLIQQGEIVAKSLQKYLERHNEIEIQLQKNNHMSFYTTDDPSKFSELATNFYGQKVIANKIKF